MVGSADLDGVLGFAVTARHCAATVDPRLRADLAVGVYLLIGVDPAGGAVPAVDADLS